MKKKNFVSILMIVCFVILLLISIIVSNLTDNNTETNTNGNTSNEEEINLESYDNFNVITVNDYLDMIKEGKHIIYIGSVNCGHCQNLKPILAQILGESDIVINYIELSTVTEEEYNDLIDSDEFLQGDWGTPLLLIFEDGVLIDNHVGYAEYDTINNFLTK